MIPTIETIVEDLIAGTIMKQQALAWLFQHAEDAGRCLRDDFAAAALQSLLPLFSSGELFPKEEGRKITEDLVAEQAYHFADAMLKARES